MPLKLAVLGAFSLIFTACSPTPAKMDLAELLDRHTTTRGGAAAVENIQSVSLELEITEPEFTLQGRYVATRDGYMRVDIFSDGARVFSEALGPDGGWQMFGDGTVADLSPGGKEALQRGIAGNLYGLHELSELGYTLKFVGSADRNSGAFWEVEQIAPNEMSVVLFFDKDTYLIASEIETSALHPDLDRTEVRQETFKSDYRETEGVVFSNRSEKKDLDTRDIMQTIIVNSRNVNKTIDSKMFRRPE